MSEDVRSPAEAPKNPAWLRRALLHVLKGVGVVVVILAACVLVLSLYVDTPEFQKQVRERLVTVLGQATGGRVEIGRLRLSLWRLDAVADHVIIHGLESEREAPYLQVDRVELQLQWVTFLSQASGPHLQFGRSIASHIALNLLEADRPQMHFIVYADGSTNQPVPEHKSTSTEPLADTLLDLQAKYLYVNNGTLLLNERAIPFNVAARNLDTKVRYESSGDQYAVTLGLNDLRTKMEQEPEVQSKLQAELTLARQAIVLTNLEFDTGRSSKLLMTGRLDDFHHPMWQGTAKGSLELKQVTALTGVEKFTGGTAELDLSGRSCAMAQAPLASSVIASRRKNAAAEVSANSPAWQACDQEYALTGSLRVRGAGFTDEYVHVRDVDGGAKVRITPYALQLADMAWYLPGGGSLVGAMHINDWLSDVESAPVRPLTYVESQGTPALVPIRSGAGHAYIDVQTTAIPLRTVMDVTAPVGYGDLGFDTAESGPVHVEFGYNGDTTIVDGNLSFAPTGVHRKGALSDVPVTGTAVARYRGGNETVAIASVHVETPATRLDADGILGVDDGDPLTQLNAEVTTHDLGEFDQLFRTLGLEYKGKRGMDAVPLKLHGDAHFVGTASGPVEMLDVKGHVDAQNVEVTLPTNEPPPPPAARPITDRLASYFHLAGTPAAAPAPPPQPVMRSILVDSVTGDAEYTPARLDITAATVKRSTLTMTAQGWAIPHPVVVHGVTEYDWDEATKIDATLNMPQAQAPDLLDVAGIHAQLSGKAVVSAHVSGTLGDLNGSGMVSLTSGAFYGEPYQRAEVDLGVSGQDIRATKAVLLLHGDQISGSGDYDLKSGHLRAHVEAANLQLGKFQTVATAKIPVDGVVSLHADADGTMKEPGVRATVSLTKMTLGGQLLGGAGIDAHSEGGTLLYTANSDMSNGRFTLSGRTELNGEYKTDAKLEMAQFDIDSLLKLYAPTGITGHSALGGTLTVNGPLATPEQMNGAAQVSDFDVNLSGIELKSAEPLRASLQDGMLKLDQVHITGDDTDLKAGGTMQLFSASAAANALHIHAEGHVNMKLAQTLDPDIISSGHVDLTMDAGGSMSSPSLSGKVQFKNVAIALEDIPNGLSQMNGTLVFNEDRLQVQSLTAMTGGGQLKIGGFMTLKGGFFADMTATGDNVRVRLNGLSSTANANLRLQGSTGSALLSGNILITRFGIGPDFDFAAFTGPGSVAAPPDPNAPSSRIRLDVHVTSSPQLDFQNSYAKLAGTVDLNIGGTVAVPAVLGRITVTDGSAKFAGQQYELQRGNIYFTNPVRIDPQVDVEATTRVENYDVTVGLHGTSSNLKPTYRSEPPLSETDIFALLALGRTQEEAQIYNEQQTAAGADPTTSAVLGGALNATVSNRVEKLFGVGTVKIDPSFVGTLGTSSARITVEQQVSRNLVVTYATNVNQTMETLIQVQMNVTDNVSVVATRDESGVFSTVLKIRRRYR